MEPCDRFFWKFALAFIGGGFALSCLAGSVLKELMK